MFPLEKSLFWISIRYTIGSIPFGSVKLIREKALDLFQAYSENKIPRDAGTIIRGFYEPEIHYHTFEITQYANIRALLLGDDGITFKSNAYRFYVIIEPASYAERDIPPALRHLKKIVPHNLLDMERNVSSSGITVYHHREPARLYGFFSISNPAGSDFALIFPMAPDVFSVMNRFLGLTLTDECGLPKDEAFHLANESVDSIKINCGVKNERPDFGD